MRNLYATATQRWGSVDLVTAAAKPAEKLTVREAAAHYGVSTTTIYRRIKTNRMIATKNERGHWTITACATLELAEMAANIRDHMTARNELDRQPPHSPRAQYAADDFYASMQQRRRNAITARQLAAA